MAFGQFKNIPAVLERFKIKYEEGDFITPTDYAVSKVFLDDFNFVRDHIDVTVSEISICESIIYPILKEVYKAYADRFALWSHKTVTYDEELTGTPGYLLATKSELGKVVLGRPLLMVLEAKKNDFDEGWGQCLSEMVMARKYNTETSFAVYGIVSDGEVWQFGRLLADQFTENRTFYTINDIQPLFGAIDFVLGSLKAQLDVLRDIQQAEKQIEEGKGVGHDEALAQTLERLER
jgi:hypothetical protein